MVVEHTFVTTLPPNEALTAAADFLSRGGFEAEAQTAFQVGNSGWTSLQMRRGRKNIARVNDAPDKCPQQIRLEWDRGRITVAASILPSMKGGNQITVGDVARFVTRKKKANRYADLMVAISQGLEMLLVQRATPEGAASEWFALESELKEQASRDRVRGWVSIAVLIALVGGLFALMIFATRR